MSVEQPAGTNYIQTILTDILERLRSMQAVVGRVDAHEEALGTLRETMTRLESKVDTNFTSMASDIKDLRETLGAKLQDVQADALKAYSPEAAAELAKAKEDRAEAIAAVDKAKGQTKFTLQLMVPTVLALLGIVGALLAQIHK